MKKIVIGILSLVLLVGCKTEEVYIFDDNNKLSQADVMSILTDPSSYIGRSVELSGRIYTPAEHDRNHIYMKVFLDPLNSTDTVVLKLDNNSTEFVKGDYILFSGVIVDQYSGVDPFGKELITPIINVESMVMSSYIDLVSPTLKEIKPGLSQEFEGIVVTVDKVQFAELETRVYYTVQNQTDTKKSFLYLYPRLFINGKPVSGTSDFLDVLVPTMEYTHIEKQESFLGFDSTKPIAYKKIDYLDLVINLDFNDGRTEGSINIRIPIH